MIGNLLTLRKVDGNLLLEPTAEGVAAAKEYLSDRDDPHNRASPDDQVHEMLDHHLCNGWLTVPPEQIGALTDALIISEDGTIPDEGGWVPVVDRAKVYAHMNYQVEDPIETWAEGRRVLFVGAEVERS